MDPRVNPGGLARRAWYCCAAFGQEEANRGTGILEEAQREGHIQARAFLRLNSALLGQLQLAQGQLDAAQASHRQLLESAERFVRQGQQRFLLDLCSAHLFLGLTHELRQELDVALEQYQSAAAV